MQRAEFEAFKAGFAHSFWQSFVQSSVILWAIVGVAGTLIYVFN